MQFMGIRLYYFLFILYFIAFFFFLEKRNDRNLYYCKRDIFIIIILIMYYIYMYIIQKNTSLRILLYISLRINFYTNMRSLNASLKNRKWYFLKCMCKSEDVKKKSYFTDSNHISRLEQGIGRTLFIFLLLSNGNVAQNLFRSGKEYIYFYNATSSTGVLMPSNAASSWSLNGKVVIQAEDDYVTIQVFKKIINIQFCLYLYFSVTKTI